MIARAACWSLGFLCFLGTAAPARAGGAGCDYHPAGFVDLYTENMAGVNMGFAVGDQLTGYIPDFSLQVGLGDFAVGLDWGLAALDIDVSGADTGFFPGSFLIHVKGKHCVPGTWSTCFGVDFGLGIGPFAFDEDDSQEDLLALAIALYHHTGRYARYAPETITFDPLLAVSTTNGTVFAQAYLGPGILVPLADTDQRDAEATLLYGIDAGVFVMDLVAAGVGFRGMSTLTSDENDSLFAFELLFRVLLDKVQPTFKVSIPFSTAEGPEPLDASITLGLLLEF